MTAREGRGRLTLEKHRAFLVTAGAFVVLAVAVVAFSGGWPGQLVLDGPASSLYLRLGLEHFGHGGRWYWFPEMWAGSPIFASVPSLPVLALLPLARWVGPDAAVKLAVVSFQVLGAWGAFVLVRAMWTRTGAAVLGGLVYGLHPLFLSHGVLIGSERSAALLASVPWLAWSLLRGLRGDGPAFVLVAGLVAAFGVLNAPDSTYALALLCQCLLAVELGRVRGGLSLSTARQVIGRAVAVVGTGLGAVAHWLVPFLLLAKWFAVSPPGTVPGDLFSDVGSRIQGNTAVFVHRSASLSGVVGLQSPGLPSRLFYLGTVCLVVTMAAIALLPAHDLDGDTTAILTAGLVGMWVTTGDVPLARSDLAHGWGVSALVVAGVATGVALGAYLERLHLGPVSRWARWAILAVIVAMPYLTPFRTLQRLLPVLFNFSFPRFYLLAPLALAVGTAFPTVVLGHRLRELRPRIASPIGAVVLAFLAAAFLVDVWPYQSFYGAQAAAASTVRDPAAARVALPTIDPAGVSTVVGRGGEAVDGWPLQSGGRQLSRLAVEAGVGPPGYRDAALGLAGAALGAPGARVLPVVRAYEEVVVAPDTSLASDLAVALAVRHVGVVTGAASPTGRLGMTVDGTVGSHAPCRSSGAPGFAGELAMACGRTIWTDKLLRGATSVDVDQEPGAVVTSPADGLRGIAVWLDRPPDATELRLYELADDGLTIGRELAEARAVGTDATGLAVFPFDPIADSGGRRYAFRLSCPVCSGQRPALMSVNTAHGGDLTVGSDLRTSELAAFTAVYDGLGPAPMPDTSVRTTERGTGRWRLETSGPRPALIVVAEARFPGWRARVDGKSVAVLGADAAFIGVVVPAGDHEVSLDYERPSAADVGRLTTAVSLAIAAALTGYGIRRRRTTTRRSAAPRRP